WPGSPPSTTITSMPRLRNEYAQQSPITPAPTTTTRATPAPCTQASQLARHSGRFLHRDLHAARSHAVAHRDQRRDAAPQRSHEAVHCLGAKHEGKDVHALQAQLLSRVNVGDD